MLWHLCKLHAGSLVVASITKRLELGAAGIACGRIDIVIRLHVEGSGHIFANGRVRFDRAGKTGLRTRAFIDQQIAGTGEAA